ncbi:MAG TPA: N-acetylmuramic acid 6-phosphate etherase [Bacteroidetes bacterium]|nr:N-acetylmuramic acid 6-phosphate etherase [Bacteroidota bacterium]HRK04598.1 N-acetylmuramic acid 6-phosphate etherase [Chlorobiota bacterium]
MNPHVSLHDILARLTTEAVNPRTEDIDMASTEDVVARIHAEDRTVADAVGQVLPNICQAVNAIVNVLRQGGHLVYVGAGTSGRLGVVDASEMPPTFGTAPDMVQALIAGGPDAVFRSQEGAEDNPEGGRNDVRRLLSDGRPAIVCGIAASGRTPYVLGALTEAHEQSHTTILVATNAEETVRPLAPFVDIFICPVVGPEAITGSTRMKSGTAQKMVLNMLTTASMVRLGKTFGNVMVDLQQTNEKLRVRSVRIVERLTGLASDEAQRVLTEAGGSVKTALCMILSNVGRADAEERLRNADGFLRRAIEKS